MGVRMGGGGSDDLAENADINITPFIDVILVLLIIFMVAAPLSTVDVAVELPTSTAPVQPRPDKPIFVSVRADLTIAVGENTVERPALADALNGLTNNDHDQRIFLRADKGVPYGDVMGAMNLLRAAGYLKIGLVGLEDTSGGAQP